MIRLYEIYAINQWDKSILKHKSMKCKYGKYSESSDNILSL